MAAAIALRANLRGGFKQARAQALPRHFHQAKVADSAKLNAGAIIAHGILHPPLNSMLIAALFHIDEVNHHQTSKVA